MSRDSVHDRLKRRWDSLALPRPLFDRLAVRYREPHRHYHNLDHIGDCFTQLDSWIQDGGPLTQKINPRALALAIFYHDAIYDTTRSDNEEASADLARSELEVHLHPAEMETVESLILATAHFDADASKPTTTADAALIVDIDLSILGRDASTYDRYADAIRREYAQVDDTRYGHGRAQVLRTFLALPKLFTLAYFNKRFETRARSNLQRELDSLSP